MSINLRRIGAYVIDYLLVVMFVALVSEIRFINPYLDEYMEAYEVYEDMSNELLQEDINEIVSNNEFHDAYYNVLKYGVVTNVVSVVVYLLYFGVFQKATKGQSLGKKLFRIKVVSDDDSNASWGQMLGRSIVAYNLIFNSIMIGLVFCFKSTDLFWGVIGINFVGMVITYMSLLLILIRKDNKGIHDIIFKTKVVMDNGN